ncbi:TetR/AcrR family transcriptional regulator [Parasphingopyxis algicola]|uniref:TetR/AcrR family transcriptional regulator n=1 Tax=Parasphingopyxis algicola TaxID=2026624 RepID=UPI0015A0038E|nr:TetR/AcrR family transcriptional regulator [Parasphingopyxis algicola]QLC24461.1 TetR/AcrR family transcriptional regulator [Parasphingopyxis algicola]
MAESTTRSINMQRRRDAILGEAQRVIGEQGFDALNLRALADAASVTVPTIYNLIGNKDALLMALFERAVTRIEAQLRDFETAPALERAEAVVIQSTGLFGADENFYRAALIAGEQLGYRTEMRTASKDFDARSVQMAANACRAGLREGLLRGRIDCDLLGAQMYAIYRTSLHDWVYQLITIDELRRNALRGFYVCLAADATDDFHAALMGKLDALANGETRAAEQAA